MPPVQFDPSAPPGNQPLKLGPSDFRTIEQNILRIFNLPTVGVNPFGSPFSFFDASHQTAGLLNVVGDPDTALGIVTKQYADARTPFIALDAGGGPNVYTATVPASFSLNTNAVYLVLNAGMTNAAGGVTLVLNATSTQVVRLDGSTPLQAGEFLNGAMYALMFDGTSFRIIGFVGGVLTQDTTLAAPAKLTLGQDPVDPLEAATKQYVDAQHHIYGLTRKPLTVDTAEPGAAVVLSQTLTTPNDGRTYRVYVAYNLCANYVGSEGHLQAYCADNPQTGLWAQSGGNITGDSGGVAASGISIVTFAANTAVTVDLHAVVSLGAVSQAWTAKANVNAFGLGTYLDMGFVLA